MTDTVYEVAAREYDKVMVPPLRQILQGRRLFASRKVLPPGSYNLDYKTLTEMGDAVISGELPLDNVEKDAVALTTSNLKLMTVHKKYQIERATWNSMQKAGYSIDADNMLSAAYKVAYAEDAMLINGHAPDGTNYVTKGLYQSANNNYSTSKDFGTATYPMVAVAGAWALLYADNVMGFNMNLTLNPTQYTELLSSVLASGAPEIEYVKRMLNPFPGAAQGEILVSNGLTAGTGLMSPADPGGTLIDLVIGQDTRNVFAQEKYPGVSPIEAIVYEVLAPRIKQTNAVCKLSAI